jgi:asparagine synthase (glutamine-hydrolysing)
MCGIAGQLRLDGGTADRTFVRRACAMMRHRGPDDEIYHDAASIALGMCRLRVIGVRERARIVSSADGAVVSVFNGEIYNHRAIRRDLKNRGLAPEGESDAHVIPGLYEIYGDEFVHELDGMFAIALYDAIKSQLILARDHLGKKPLFYSEMRDGGVVFASELAALMVHPRVSRELSADAVDQFLSYRVIPAPHTIYRRARKLEPGSQLFVRTGLGARAVSYWQPSFSDELQGVTDDEAADELHRRLASAVDARLEAEVPLGAMLSGGLDSSLVVAMANAKRDTGTFKTFSVGFADPLFDERPHAQRVADHLGVGHRCHEITPADALQAIDPILVHTGEPFAFPSAIASYYMYRLAAQSVTVVLTGDGSDELFCGYDRYRRFLTRWQERRGKDTLSDIYESVLIDGLDNDVKRRLLAASFASRLATAQPHNYLTERFERTTDGSHELSRIMQVDCRFWLTDAQLVKIDRMAMAHSVEPRSPMLDRHVVEYAGALPTTVKLAANDVKVVLKRVARKYLPEAVVSRPKQELAVPLEGWLAHELRPLIEQVVTSEKALSRGYFNPDALRAFVRDRRRQDSYALWTLFMLERWHCLFTDDTSDREQDPPSAYDCAGADQASFSARRTEVRA